MGYYSRIISEIMVGASLLVTSCSYPTPSGRPVFYGNPDLPILRYNPNEPKHSIEDKVNQPKAEPAKDYHSQTQTLEPKINLFDPKVQRKLRMEAAGKQTIRSADDPRFQELVGLLKEKKIENARRKHDEIKGMITPSLENYYRGLGGR